MATIHNQLAITATEAFPSLRIGRWYHLTLSGNLDGATATLQFTDDAGSTWTDHPSSDATTTATPLSIEFQACAESMRLELDGGTSPACKLTLAATKEGERS